MMESQIDRRQILRLLGLSPMLSLANCCLPPPNAEVPRTADSKSIDVHCHVFNADDIPIVGFATLVVLENKKLLANAIRPTITLVAFIMRTGAIGAKEELAKLSAPEGTATDNEDDLDRYYRRLAIGLANFSSPTLELQSVFSEVDKYLPVEPWPGILSTGAENDAFLRSLLPPPAPGAPSTLSTDPAVVRAFFADPGTNEKNLRSGLIIIPPAIKGVLQMATLMTRSRFELVARLGALPATDAADVMLITPSMVDYSFFLNDLRPTDPEDQIAVMSKIAADPRRPFAVHPFVAFCPWRQIVEERQLADLGYILKRDGGRRTQTQFELLKAAVLSGACIGAKLYPPMGFRPIGNANGMPQSRFSQAPSGEEFDRVLSALYCWCQENAAPVMAHCSYSQFTSPAAGECAAPENWLPVAEKWKGLRVNLGHAGGPWNSLKGKGVWTEKALEVIASCPNFYADISDYDTIMFSDAELSSDDRRIFALLTEWIHKSPGAKPKLLYGTDWIMLAKTVGSDAYYPSMKARMSKVLELDPAGLAGYLGGNAARFLGIAGLAGPNTPRSRLDEFYRRIGRDTSWLGRWDNSGGV